MELKDAATSPILPETGKLNSPERQKCVIDLTQDTPPGLSTPQVAPTLPVNSSKVINPYNRHKVPAKAPLVISPIVINSSPETSQTPEKSRKDVNHNDDDDDDDEEEEKEGQRGQNNLNKTIVIDSPRETSQCSNCRGKNPANIPKNPIVDPGPTTSKGSKGNGPEKTENKTGETRRKRKPRGPDYSAEEDEAIIKALLDLNSIKGCWNEQWWLDFASGIPVLQGRTGYSLEKHFRTKLKEKFEELHAAKADAGEKKGKGEDKEGKKKKDKM